MKHLFFTIFLLSILHCRTPEIKEDIKPPDYIEHDQKKFYLYDSKQSKALIDRLLGFGEKVSSFSGDFIMRIKSGDNLSENNLLKGKILFDKTTGNVKITLMEPIFGFIVTTVLANPEIIKVKAAGQKMHTQGMGDISIINPKNNKPIHIPFAAIYHSISYNFLKEFQTQKSFFSPEENRVLVKKDKETYQYVFIEEGLDSLDYSSIGSKLKAIAKIDERKPDLFHPPLRISTRVKDTETNKDTGLIEIKYTHIKLENSIPLSEFVI